MFLFVNFSGFCDWYWKGKTEDVEKVAVVQEQKIFTFQALISATNNFEDKLGQGGFGPVFKVWSLTLLSIQGYYCPFIIIISWIH